MKKLILVILFLGVLGGIASKAFVALFAYQSMQKFKEGSEANASVSYSWLSSDLAGKVIFEDVQLRPFPLKRTYFIEELELDYGSFSALLSGLMSLRDGNWSSLQSLKLRGVSAPLEGRDIDEWLVSAYEPAYGVPLGLYACGDRSRVHHNDLHSMGVRSLSADVAIERKEAIPGSAQQFDISIDMNELGRTQLSLMFQSEIDSTPIGDIDVLNLPFSGLSVVHLERGYFRRLSNYCVTEQQDRTRFSNLAAAKWSVAMSSIGFDMSEAAIKFYRDYLMLGGQITLHARPQAPVRLKQSERLLDKELVSTLGLVAEFNGQPVPLGEINLDGTYYRPAPVVENKAELKPDLEAKSKSFQSIEWEALSDLKSDKMKIVTSDGKVYEGRYVSSDEYVVDINKMVDGGILSYHLKKTDVEQLLVWR